MSRRRAGRSVTYPKLIVSAPADAEVAVWNVGGQNVTDASVKAGRTILDLGLNAGVYMVKITSADGQELTVKMVAR